jgi:hypothetical protein
MELSSTNYDRDLYATTSIVSHLMRRSARRFKSKEEQGISNFQIPAEFWQAVEGNVETEMLFKNCIRSYWLNEGTPSD